jgi:hypothetical protein
MSEGFEPTAADLRAWSQRGERAEKRWRNWREEYSIYRSLYANDVTMWNLVAPGMRAVAPGRVPTQSIVRNGVGENVWTDVRDLVFKNPAFSASPEASVIEVRGQLVDGNMAAYAQAETVSYFFRRMNITETLTSVVEDGKLANMGCMKLIFRDGGDAEETVVWPESSGESWEKGGGRKLGVRGPAISLTGVNYPVYVWVDVDDVTFDPDACLRGQVNWVRHRLKKPLSQMRLEQIDDPSGEIDPDSGEIRKIPKYRNLDKVKPNYRWYEQSRLMNGRGDPSNDAWANTDYDPDDYLVFDEYEIRIPAHSEEIRRQNGGKVPKTVDGFVRYLLCITDIGPDGKMDGPVCIRWQKQPVDIGNFAVRFWQPRKKSGSLVGYSAVRNAYEANIAENYWWSYITQRQSRQKGVRLADGNIVDPVELKKAEQAEFEDTVIAHPAAGKTLADAFTHVPTVPMDPAVFSLAQNMRAISDQGYGLGPNQRGVYSGSGASATESQIIATSVNQQREYEQETLKEFMEMNARDYNFALRAILPEEGMFEIPGTNGAFLHFDRRALELACSFQLHYGSMIREDDPVKRKELENFQIMVSRTPPNLWRTMLPLWRYAATTYSPGMMAAYREFERGFLAGQRNDTQPDLEHLRMREGFWVEPDPNEDFVTNIPLHQKMLAQITDDPSGEWRGWLAQTAEGGATPMQLLTRHIEVSQRMAMDKGLGPALGLSGDRAGSARKDRGSGVASGRTSQGVGNAGELAAGAKNVSEGLSS